jgi:hypothetical protein
MSGWSGLVQVTTRKACFGMVVADGTVVDCAPYGRSASMNRPIDKVADYWRKQGGRVDVVSTRRPTS